MLVYENVLFRWSDEVNKNLLGEICENGIVVKKDDFVERFDLYRLSILLVDSFMDEREEWEKVMFLILNFVFVMDFFFVNLFFWI